MKNLIYFLLFLPFSLFAQKIHKVEAKESLYSIARKYDINPKDLAAYNNMSINDGINIGQIIKIPSSNNNNKSSTTKDKSNSKENKLSNPIFHKVEKKETLYQVGKKYGVSVEELKKWNHLTADGVNEGSQLIVGYEKNKVEKKESDSHQNKSPKIDIAKKNDNPNLHSNQNDITKDTIAVIGSKNEIKDSTKNKTQNVSVQKNSDKNKGDKNGFFESDYFQQMTNKSIPSQQNGKASTFKSTSGWDDNKYYCLFNGAPAGSFIKITNTMNQKFVYAKVLDVIPDLKQNDGVVIVMSKSSASQMSATTEKFDVEIDY